MTVAILRFYDCNIIPVIQQHAVHGKVICEGLISIRTTNDNSRNINTVLLCINVQYTRTVGPTVGICMTNRIKRNVNEDPCSVFTLQTRCWPPCAEESGHGTPTAAFYIESSSSFSSSSSASCSNWTVSLRCPSPLPLLDADALSRSKASWSELGPTTVDRLRGRGLAATDGADPGSSDQPLPAPPLPLLPGNDGSKSWGGALARRPRLTSSSFYT